MGCDIHAHLEVKIDGEWLYYQPMYIQRDYRLFSKMAGVRAWPDDPPPISDPRGIPMDSSKMTLIHFEYDGADGHSHSYLLFDEIVELVDWYAELYKIDDMEVWSKMTWNEVGPWLFGNCIHYYKKYPNDYPDFVEDVRLIFWFDN